MLNVKHHWDPLKTCVVGTTYTPDFYSFITDKTIRDNLCTIAQQTLDDLSELEKLLQSFGVSVFRPSITDRVDDVRCGNKILPAPLTPRDYIAVIEDKVFLPTPDALGLWNKLRGADWPSLPPAGMTEFEGYSVEELYYLDHTWIKQLQPLCKDNPVFYDKDVDSAMVQRLGDTLLVGNWHDTDVHVQEYLRDVFPNKIIKPVNTKGHLDSCICAVSPNLVLTMEKFNFDVQGLFPDSEIVRLSTSVGKKFDIEQRKNIGNWWVPDSLKTTEFADYVDTYLSHWVGHIQETHLDVNLLVIDPNNVVCSNYDSALFKIFENHNITPHVVNFRHQLFWDSGIHCLTADLDRQC